MKSVFFWPPPCRGLWSQWRRLCFTPLPWTLQKTDYFSEVVKYLLASRHKTTCTHWAWQLDVHADTFRRRMSCNKIEEHYINHCSANKLFPLFCYLSQSCTVIHQHTHLLLFSGPDMSSKTPESIKSSTCLEPTLEQRGAGGWPERMWWVKQSECEICRKNPHDFKCKVRSLTRIYKPQHRL